MHEKQITGLINTFAVCSEKLPTLVDAVGSSAWYSLSASVPLASLLATRRHGICRCTGNYSSSDCSCSRKFQFKFTLGYTCFVWIGSIPASNFVELSLHLLGVSWRILGFFTQCIFCLGSHFITVVIRANCIKFPSSCVSNSQSHGEYSKSLTLRRNRWAARTAFCLKCSYQISQNREMAYANLHESRIEHKP